MANEKNENYEFIGKLALSLENDMTIITYSDLSKKLQEKFGKTYTHPIAVGAGVKAASKYWEQKNNKDIVRAIRFAFVETPKHEHKQIHNDLDFDDFE